MLKGDLNEVQQLALVTALGEQGKREFERDWRNFVLTMIAVHPQDARRILRLLDRDRQEEPGAFAEEMEEEEMQEYVPVQEREDFSAVMRDLQRMGFAVVETED